MIIDLDLEDELIAEGWKPPWNAEDVEFNDELGDAIQSLHEQAGHLTAYWQSCMMKACRILGGRL